MKLKFEKTKDGAISVKIGDRSFTTKDYIQMIKDIKNEEKMEAEFGDGITQEEQNSVNSMLDEVNNIKETEAEDEGEGEGGEPIDILSREPSA